MSGNSINAMWFPLSAAQKSRWFSYQLDPEGQGAHNNAFALRIRGDIAPEFLKKVVHALLKRHPMLRATFRLHEGKPEQSIADVFENPLQVFDLREVDQNETRKTIHAESVRAFELTRSPLMRVNLFLVDDEEAVLQLVLDHIISDGWSYWILLDELTESLSLFEYEIEVDDAHDAESSYFEYVSWQQQWLDSAEASKQWHYWEGMLSHELPILQLQTDRPKPQTSRHQQHIVSLQLDETLTSGLSELVRQQSSTLFVILLAAYQILLHRHTGQNEILVGTAMPARNRKEWEYLIGDFVNPIAIGATFDADPGAATVLRAVRGAALNGMSNQDYPFSVLVEKLKLSGAVHHPVFQTMFVLQKARHGNDILALWDDAKKNPGLWRGDFELSAYPVHHSGGTAGFALSLEAIQFEKNIRCEFKFDPELYDRATIEVLTRHYKNLLRALVSDPSLPVSRLDLSDEAEQRKLLPAPRTATYNATSEVLIHRRFETMAHNNADAIAVSFADQHLSYRALNARANQVAHYLVAQGVGPEDRVSIFLERSLELIIGVLGILKAGAAYVPIDPAYPTEHITHVLRDSTPTLLITQSTLLERLPEVALPLLIMDEASHIAVISQQPQHDPDPRQLGLGGHHLAYIIYTSGSTGLPKGVMIEHRNVTRLFSVTEEKFNINANDVWTLFHSIAFDFSVWELWGALFYGGRLVVVPVACARSTDEFYTLLCQQKVTVLNQTPSAFRQMITAQSCSEQAHSLRYIIFGGEALELHTLSPWFAQNQRAPTRLINMYGITEITVHATYREITAADIDTCNGSVIGEPLADLDLFILDRHLQLSPLDIAGEIYIGGAGVARGYWNRPELTAERFISHPLCPGARLYKTGDLARRTATGEIIYLGRNDFQVKIRGFRIELGEVEAKLASCDGIREAAVIAREDVPGDKRLVAYVVMKPGSDFSVPALRKALAAVLPPHMIPSAFVCLAVLPLTANGKLDRRALPSPDREALASRPFEAPQGPIEQALAEAWRAVLKVDQISRNDHFFELGGHSLLVVSLMERLRQQQLSVDVRTVFTTPVLRELATVLESRRSESSSPLTAAVTDDNPQSALLPLGGVTEDDLKTIQAEENTGLDPIRHIYPLAPLQQGILFHHLMNPVSDFYLLRTVLSFASRGRLDQFLAALQQTVDRHDVLRSAMRWEGLSQPLQVVYARLTLPVTVLDVPDSPAPGEALAWLCSHTDPACQRLDLTVAPLMAAYIVEDPASGEWLLALLHHHIISDHHTLKLVLNDVARQLNEEKTHAGDSADVVPYRAYVAQALSRSQHEDEAYFKAQLSHIDTPTAPFGIHHVPVTAHAPNEQRYVIKGALASDLRTATRRQGASPAVLFHLAWAKVLGLICGRDEVVFGSVLSGRQSTPGAERMLGVFINTLPLRISLTDFPPSGTSTAGNSVASALKATFMQLTELLSHEMAPLALAQRCSGVASALPLFTSLLNYRHTQDESLVYENGLPQLNWEGIKVVRDDERTHYPVTFSINDVGDRFVLTLQTVDDVDGTLLLNCFNQTVMKLVEALIHSPDQPFEAVNCIASAETEKVLQQRMHTLASQPSEQKNRRVEPTANDEKMQIIPGSLEHALAEIWTSLLGAQHIDMASNFIDLGGHSLNMMQLSSRIRMRFGITLPINALFELTTLQEMASMIRAMTGMAFADDSCADDAQETEEFSL